MGVNKVVSPKKLSIVADNLHPVHLEDLAKSGITNKTAIANGLKSVTVFPEIQHYLKSSGIPIKGKHVDSLLLFPYRSLNGEQWRPRLKVFPPLTYEDKENHSRTMKYLQGQGSSNHLYLPKDVDPKANTPLWITEGEKKALCLTANGFPTISVSGVWNWKKKGDDGISQAIVDFDLFNWKVREVSLVFDSDKANNSHVRKAEQALADELTERGANVIIVNLPYGKDEVKGVDDFIVKYGKDEFKQVHKEVYKKGLSLDDALFGASPLAVTFGEFADLDLPKREYILQGDFPLEKGSINLISASAAAGKTMFLLEIAKMMGSGDRGLADTCYAPEIFPVLYVDGELPTYEITERSTMFGLNDLPHLTLISKIYLEMMGVSPVLNLNEITVRDKLTKYIVEKKFALVILDNIFSLFSGLDFNSAESWQAANDWLLHLRAKGVAVFLAHHTGKNNDQLGSVMKLANLTNALILKPEKPDNGDDHCCFSVQIQKQRGLGNKLPGKQFHCKNGEWWTESKGENDQELCQTAVLLDEGKSLQVIADKLYRFRTDSDENIKKDKSKNKSKVRRSKDILIDKKYIVAHGKEFKLTDSGKTWMDSFNED